MKQLLRMIFIKYLILRDYQKAHEYVLNYYKNTYLSEDVKLERIKLFLFKKHMHRGICNYSFIVYNTMIYEKSYIKKFKTYGYYWARPVEECKTIFEMINSMETRIEILKKLIWWY